MASDITEALRNPVRIALRNGKVFDAAILNISSDGERIEIIRLPSRRREFLNYGSEPGEVSEICPVYANPCSERMSLYHSPKKFNTQFGRFHKGGEYHNVFRSSRPEGVITTVVPEMPNFAEKFPSHS